MQSVIVATYCDEFMLINRLVNLICMGLYLSLYDMPTTLDYSSSDFHIFQPPFSQFSDNQGEYFVHALFLQGTT